MKNYTLNNYKDLALIKEIQSFFNGKIYLLNNSKVVFFRIKSVKDLASYVIPQNAKKS